MATGITQFRRSIAGGWEARRQTGAALHVLAFDILYDQIVRPNVIQMAEVGVFERGNRAGCEGEAWGGPISMSTNTESKGVLVRPGRFERPTFCSGGKRSIQLSYGRMVAVFQL